MTGGKIDFRPESGCRFWVRVCCFFHLANNFSPQDESDKQAAKNHFLRILGPASRERATYIDVGWGILARSLGVWEGAIAPPHTPTYINVGAPFEVAIAPFYCRSAMGRGDRYPERRTYIDVGWGIRGGDRPP